MSAAAEPLTARSRGGTRPPAGLSRGRLVLLAGGGFGLVMGLWTGLARAGVHDPVGPVAEHGVLMVLGFLGTLIALERAVAIRTWWAHLAPAASGLAVAWLVAGLPAVGAGLLVTLGGAVVCGVYAVTLRRHVEGYLVLMAAGGLAWVLAAGLWTLGWSPVRLAPALGAFLVLTIVGERLELSRLRLPTPAVRRRLHAAAAVYGAGVLGSLVHRPSGLVVMSAGLLGMTAWLSRHDVARVTIRRPGLPRFAAVCLLSGYVWMAVSAALWAAVALGAGGGLIHDAALHALFLGFVISMVMGHASIILPAVLRISLPYHPSAWVPLVLLHASVALRVGADLAESVWLRGWAAHGNVTALLVFVGLAVGTAVAARPRRG